MVPGALEGSLGGPAAHHRGRHWGRSLGPAQPIWGLALRGAGRFYGNVQEIPAGLTVLDEYGVPVELRSLATAAPVLIGFLRHFG